MAINIQEILHPSDSDSIKFEKINYNFDQILANGGGPVGPTGSKGNQGIVGLTGQKGQKGELGNKGESGDTTSPWKSIAIDLNVNDGVDNVTILKPKPDDDKETPVIWLGDSTFVNSGTLNDGDVSLRSTLNVGRHYNFDTGSIEAQYMTFWHNADKKIVIDSEDVTTGSGYVRYNLSPVNPISPPNPDIRFRITLPTIHTGEFKLENFNTSGNFEDGMIRYNTGSDNFEGYVNGDWKAFCMDPCGQGGASTNSISISGGDLVLQGDGQLDGDDSTYSQTTTTSSTPASSSTSSTSSTSSSTTLASLAEFTCNTSGLQVSVLDGTVGNNVQWSLTWNGNAISPAAAQPIQYVAGNNSYDLSFEVPAGFSNSGNSITCSDTANGMVATVPGEFDFTGWSSSNNTSGSITSNNTDVDINNSAQVLTVSFDWNGDSIAGNDFAYTSGWATLDVVNFNSETESGSIVFDILSNASQSSNTRSFNLSAMLPTVYGSGVDAVNINQDGQNSIVEVPNEGMTP